MNARKAGTAISIVGLVTVAATQAQSQRRRAAAASLPPSGEIHVTQDSSRRWGEVQIAVNPRNPNNIAYAIHGFRSTHACIRERHPDCEMIQGKLAYTGMPLSQPRGVFSDTGAFNIMPIFVTFDRGRTWKRSYLPAHPVGLPRLTGHGDPSITVAPDGTFYASWDANNWGTPENMLPEAAVGVSKSTDGGLTWSEPSISGTPVDGPKIVADQTTGTVYVGSSSLLGPRATGNAKDPSGKVATRWLASTRDGVRWTRPQSMGGSGSKAAAHGVLSAAFTTLGQNTAFSDANNELCGDKPKPCTIFQTTADAGASWTRFVMPAHANGGNPAVAADPTRRGHFAVALPMKSAGEYHVYQTFDSGRTWRTPAIVTEDASKRHFHGTMAYSPSGVLGIVWRSQDRPPGQPERRGPGEGGGLVASYSAWAAISRDGGLTFSRPFKLSSADSPAQPATRGSGDDYSGIALDREYLYAAWADWRPGERSGYFRAVRFADFRAR